MSVPVNIILKRPKARSRCRLAGTGLQETVCMFGDTFADPHKAASQPTDESDIRYSDQTSDPNQLIQWKKGLKDLGPSHIINVGDLGSKLEISGSEFVASYNWKKGESVIFVPGGPPQYTPPTLPITLSRDVPQAINHEIVANTTSFAPLFLSLTLMKPDFNMNTIDLVTTPSCLSRLLAVVMSNKHDDDDIWRTEVELVNGTVFLSRWESDQLRTANGSNLTAHGHNFRHDFKNRFTTYASGLEDSENHHRAISYSIGALRCLVLYEADAYIKNNNVPKLDVQSPGFSLDKTLSPAAQDSARNQVPRVVQAGHLVPESSIIELHRKTARTSKNLLRPRALRQLLLSRTFKVYRGRENNGCITKKIEVQTMDERFQNFEANYGDNLKGLVGLVRVIRELAAKCHGCKMSLLCNPRESKKRLEVFETLEQGMMLSDEVKERFWGRHD